MLKYNSSTQLFLKDISNGKLSQEILDEIQEYNLIYYDGGIVIDVKIGSENSIPIKIHLKQDSETILKELNQFIENESSDLAEEDRSHIIQQFLVTKL